jgi:uncharacterized protein involved in exopolysaccharide biosynthesis
VAQTATKPQPEITVHPDLREADAPIEDDAETCRWVFTRARLLWSARRFLARATVLGLIAATLIAFLIPKRYESTTRLMPPDSQSAGTLALMAGIAGQTGGLGAIAGDLLGVKTTGALFVGVLQSQTVQNRIIKRFDLKKVYSVRLDVSAEEKLAKNTGISEDRKSGIITVTATDSDARRAAAIAGAYVEELDTLMAQLTTSSAHRERIFLEERLDAVKQDLETAEKDFSEFASQNTTLDVKEQGKAMIEAAAALEGQLIAAQTELQSLRQIYTDNNVRVRATQARVTELQNQIEKLGGKAESSPDPPSSPNKASYPTLRQLPLLGVPYADKYRQLKIQEAVYETLTKEYELAKVQEAKEIPAVRVLDAPVVPERKSYPPRLMIIVSGTLLALAIAVLWVFGKADWSETDNQDPRKQLALEVFTSIKGAFARSFENGSRTGAAALDCVDSECNPRNAGSRDQQL